MLYPLKFKPVYKDYIWGGRSLVNIGKEIPPGRTAAESWEISGHENGLSIVAEGPLAGRTLPQILKQYGRRLLGSAASARDLQKFPLLLKLIGACDQLSIQVHPDDIYAAKHTKDEYGKNEMWYVVAAEPGARLIAGIKPGTSREIFARAIKDSTCLDHLKSLPVQAGDAINIPAGLVHAIGAGLIICEIQQNSDMTYRVYDYNRKDTDGHRRPLHIEQALDVINFSAEQPDTLVPGIFYNLINQPELKRRALVINRYLRTEHWQLNGEAAFNSRDEYRFVLLTVLGGKAELAYESADRKSDKLRINLDLGESILIPADLGCWKISGSAEMITATVSDFTADLHELGKNLSLSTSSDNTRQLINQLKGRIGMDPLPDNLKI